MIAFVEGRLYQKEPGQVVVMVGGVGYRLAIPVSTFYALPALGDEVVLRVYTHVREDVFALYGFVTAVEETLFSRLISVAGVGPSLALKIMSGLEPRELANAIRRSDSKRLNSIPGVGKKTAERLILELKDKLSQVDTDASSEPVEAEPEHRAAEDLTSALVNLGYSRQSAESAVQDVLNDSPEISFEQALKRILRALSG